MGMKYKFSQISSNQNIIFSLNFLKKSNYLIKNKWFLGGNISQYFNILSGFAFKSQDYCDEGISVLRIGDIKKDGSVSTENMVKVPDLFEDKFPKFLIRKNDILIAMTGATIGKTAVFKDIDIPILLNQRVGLLRLKENVNANLEFLLLLLKNPLFQVQVDINSMGKSQPNISPTDILSIKIPIIPIEYQNKIVKKVEPLKKDISEVQKIIQSPTNIINQFFGEALGFNWEEFENIKREKIYSSTISKFANNIDCRMGIRFHNKAGKYLQSFLENKTSKRIKDFIEEPIVLGKSVSPSDYDKEGEFYYIAMSNIKSWAFDPEDCKKISEEYALKNVNKTVKKGDIILARSGEGTIGKVALIEDEDINGIFADFTQRIRLTGFDPLCAYYYFRSDFFQYLVYTHKKGLGNNTNIFPSQIKEFPIPDWDEKQQADIVKAIKTQLDEQKQIDRQIEAKQQEINKIIEDAIK